MLAALVTPRKARRMRLLSILLLGLLLPVTAAEAAWREASTPHFVIYSEESAESLKAFATRLETFDKAMRTMRGMADPPLGPTNRLTIYVVPSLGSVQRVAGKGSANVAGFYVPRASGSIAIVPRSTGMNGKFDLDAQTVLLHEYTHHFMMTNSASAAYPAWFVEGFAEFNATTRFEKDGTIGFGLPATHRAYGLLLLTIPAEKLFTGDTNSRDGKTTEAFYSRAWLMTHFLTFEPSRAGQLSAYLKAINAGRDSLAAARDTFGDFKKLDAELDKYKLRRRLAYRRVAPDPAGVGAITMRALSAAEDALMELRIQSDRGVDRTQARTLVTRIRKAAAPFANDASAQAILAEAEYDAGNYALAEAAADRALAANPRHLDALLYKGRALMGKATEAKSDDAKAWREIRGWFIKANQIDAEHAEPLYLFYDSFREQGIRPNANAVAGLIKAHDLAPQDRGLRMRVARQFLVDAKVEDARYALAPIAYDPHAGPIGKVAAALLAVLKDGNAKAALQVWDAAGEKTGGAADAE
jgi:tetratricopeptide (TPR) repeat protein